MHRLFLITYSGTRPSLVTDVLKQEQVRDRYKGLVGALKAQAQSMPDGERLHVSTLSAEEFF